MDELMKITINSISTTVMLSSF